MGIASGKDPSSQMASLGADDKGIYTVAATKHWCSGAPILHPTT